MLKDITIGQYYPVGSVVHGLDPRTKLSGTVIFLISLFVNQSLWGYLYAVAFLGLVIYASQVPLSYMLRGLKSIVIIVCFSLIMTMLFTKGTVWIKIGFIQITFEGVRLAVFLGIRIVLLVIGSSLMTLTTTPNALTDGLETGLGFLRVIHFPVHAMAMMMSIALRFIPILTEEADKIMRAQMARCADFEEGGMWQRIRSMVPLFVPLIISAFRRAADLALAMDARCYRGGEGRTKMKPLRYQKRDRITYLILFVYLLGMIGLRFFLEQGGWT